MANHGLQVAIDSTPAGRNVATRAEEIERAPLLSWHLIRTAVELGSVAPIARAVVALSCQMNRQCSVENGKTGATSTLRLDLTCSVEMAVHFNVYPVTVLDKDRSSGLVQQACKDGQVQKFSAAVELDAVKPVLTTTARHG
jgi:hypothetical protein